MQPHRNRIWALVMDATRARIVRDVRAKSVASSTELVLRTEGPRLKDIIASRPRNHLKMVGGSEQVTEDERLFVHQVVTLLDAHRRSEDFDALAIYAGPDTLALIRKEMPEALRQVVIREVPQDLLNLSPRDLPSALAEDIGPDNHVR